MDCCSFVDLTGEPAEALDFECHLTQYLTVVSTDSEWTEESGDFEEWVGHC